MRRILSLLTAVFAFLAAMAQSPGITLSTQGKMLFFDADKLATAIETAQPNDTIWLGPGNYTIDEIPAKNEVDYNGITRACALIQKPLVFIGAGADKTTLTTDKNRQITILLENENATVALEGICYSLGFIAVVENSNLNNLILKDCYIYRFWVSPNANVNTLQIDRCRIRGNFEIGNDRVGRLNVRNSYFDCMNSYDHNYIQYVLSGYCKEPISGASFVNCYVRALDSKFIGYFLNSFAYDAGPANSSSTFESCVFKNYPTNAQVIDGKKYEEEDYMEAVENPDYALEKGFIGNDGTVVGIYGGNDLKYSLIPAYPTPDTDNSTLVYDKENNKIKVSVKLREE